MDGIGFCKRIKGVRVVWFERSNDSAPFGFLGLRALRCMDLDVPLWLHVCEILADIGRQVAR